MSNRFHNKFHRVNHHSIGSPDPKFPDAGYDPIASFGSPFQGEFYSQGDIITTENLSAYKDLTIGINGYIGNNLTIGYDALIKNNLVVEGDFTVLGTTSQVDTLVFVTSAMDLVNFGTGPAMSVKQTGNEIVAQFLDDENTALIISGLSSTPGYVGINTATPNEQLTLVGNFSARGDTIVTGNSFLSGSSYIERDLTVNNGVLYVDSINNKIGANTLTPNEQLTLVGNFSAQGNTIVTGNNFLSGDVYIQGSNINIANIQPEQDNTVVVLNSLGFLKTDEINPQIWNTSANFISAFNGNLDAGYIQKAANQNGLERSVVFENVQGNIGINTTSPNKALTVVGSISTTENIAAQSSTIPVSVIDLTTDKIFSITDTNKVFHFNTSSAPLFAIFPNTLPDGFNVALMNTGTFSLSLSTNGPYKARGSVIFEQYAGAYVYKTNSELFAVGGF